MTNKQRIEQLEAEVKSLREQVNKILGERQASLVARDESIRTNMGLRG